MIGMTGDTSTVRIERRGRIALLTIDNPSRGNAITKKVLAELGEAVTEIEGDRALRAAISVAHQQGARSFGLRAALALAKLVQSMGRPVEAHTVLAPALEGFSLTPEMPEIEEAQALLEDLAVGDKQVSVGPGERA